MLRALTSHLAHVLGAARLDRGRDLLVGDRLDRVGDGAQLGDGIGVQALIAHDQSASALHPLAGASHVVAEATVAQIAEDLWIAQRLARDDIAATATRSVLLVLLD